MQKKQKKEPAESSKPDDAKTELEKAAEKKEQPAKPMAEPVEDTPELHEAEPMIFARHVGARIEESGVTVANLKTGERRMFPTIASGVVECFAIPQTVHDALLECTKGKDSPQLVDLFRIISELIEMGALVPLSEESGPGDVPQQLPSGWKAASDFIQATRTNDHIVYLTSQEISQLLVQDLSRGRQPSCFCERTELPFYELPDKDKMLEEIKKGPDFASILLKRRTARRYADKPMTMEELGKLLFFTWGAVELVPNPMGDYFVHRTSPGGGSLHPVEVYPIISNVEGLPPGSYHYSVRRHGLELISENNPKEWIAAACGDQYWIAECPVVFACTAFLPRMAWKYDFSRAFRVVMADVGHTSQTLNLTATWMGLGAFTTCALRDEIFEKQLGLNPMLEPMLLVNGAGHLEEGRQKHDRPRYEEEVPSQ